MNRPYRMDAEAIARRLNPSARRSPSGWWSLPGICHDRRDRPHLGVRDNRGRDGSDVVSVKCWAGCDRDSVRRAIEGATGWRIWGQRIDDSPAPRTPASPQNRETPRDRTEYARQLWAASFRIDQDPDHPVRRWVARRGLYWPAPVPLPSCYSLAAGWSAQPAAPGRGRDRGGLRSARRMGRTLAPPPQPDLHRAGAPGRRGTARAG